MSEILNQEDIDVLLEAISSNSDGEYKPDEDTRNIGIYDFNRPYILSENQLCEIDKVFDEFCYEFRDYLEKKYGRQLKIKILRNNLQHYTSEQVTYNEFLSCCFDEGNFGDFQWNGGAGVISYDNFKCKDQYFNESDYDSIINILYECMNRRAGVTLGKIKNCKNVKNKKDLRNFTDLNDMGIIILIDIATIDAEIGNPFVIFLNKDFIDSIRKTHIFSGDGRLKKIPLINPDLYTTVEAGRCYLDDDFVFEKGQVILLDRKLQDNILVVHNDKIVFTGEMIVYYEEAQLAVRTNCSFGKPENDKINQSMNTKVIIGGFNFDPKVDYDYSIIKLDVSAMDKAKIVKNGKMVAEGEVCVVDGMMAVKVV